MKARSIFYGNNNKIEFMCGHTSNKLGKFCIFVGVSQVLHLQGGLPVRIKIGVEQGGIRVKHLAMSFSLWYFNCITTSIQLNNLSTAFLYKIFTLALWLCVINQRAVTLWQVWSCTNYSALPDISEIRSKAFLNKILKYPINCIKMVNCLFGGRDTQRIARHPFIY